LVVILLFRQDLAEGASGGNISLLIEVCANNIHTPPLASRRPFWWS
jgi:hypothetical protein